MSENLGPLPDPEPLPPHEVNTLAHLAWNCSCLAVLILILFCIAVTVVMYTLPR